MNSMVKLSAIRFALCSICIVGLGFSLYGNRIFDHHLMYHQVLLLGAIVPLFVVAMQALRPRWVVLLGVVAYGAMAFQTRPGTSALLVRDAVWLVSVILTVRLCLWSSRFLPPMRFGKFVAWGAVFSLTFVGALYLLAFVHSALPNPEIPPTVAKMGALVGLGAGIGFELSELIAGDPNVGRGVEVHSGRTG